MNKYLRYVFDKDYRFVVNCSRGLYKKKSDYEFICRLFKAITGERPNFEKPTTFDEKMQWLKLYDHNPDYVCLVDKSESKKILRSIIGDDYIIPTLGCWKKFDDINFDDLPDKFILKTTHDSGTHCICRDKKTFNFRKAKKKINAALKRNYYYLWREWPYKNVIPQIIAEPLLENADNSPLVDYKFYCYGGKPQYFMYSIGEAEHNVKNHKFNMKGESIDSLFKSKPSLSLDEIVLPDNLPEMVEIVNKLSGIAQHVRIDLFNVDGHIYMGEVTFFTNGGFISIANKEYKQSLADLIDLSKVKRV